jgi:hypothetical protein
MGRNATLIKCMANQMMRTPVEHNRDWKADRPQIVQKVTCRLIPFVELAYLIAHPGDGSLADTPLQLTPAGHKRVS